MPYVDPYFMNKALSKSAIDKMLQCPAMYRAWELDEDEPLDTTALTFGKVFHTLVLEPEEFDKRYHVTDYALTTKDGKAAKAHALANDLEIIKSNDHEMALCMAEAARMDVQASVLLQDFDAESSIYWTEGDIECKCKPDIIARVGDLTFCGDLKSCESANPIDIVKSMGKYNYHRQAAWYLRGLKASGIDCRAFIFIFVSKKAPHLVTCATLDEDAMQKGLADCLSAVQSLQDCRNKASWPCFTDNVLTLSLPKWSLQEGAIA